jgi:hypothetical protein
MSRFGKDTLLSWVELILVELPIYSDGVVEL